MLRARRIVLGLASVAVSALVGCEKTPSVGADRPPTSGSSGAGGSEVADGAASVTPPAPQTTKSGPTPNDPLLANVSPMPMPPSSLTAPLANANNAFAFDLWSHRNKAPDVASSNALLSPASISIAFAMAGLGARGETAAQIRKTLRFEGDETVVAEGWGKLARAMTTPPRPYELRIANRLYGEKTYTFEPTYLERTKTLLDAPLEPVDFKTAFEPARQQINAWVEDRTQKRITNLLPNGAVDATSRLVLVNAIYFLADWATPFDKAFTHDAPFFATPMGKAIEKKVPTMHRTGSYRLAKQDGVTLLELPYKNDETAMLVVLPDAKDGLPAVEKALTAAKFGAWQKALGPAQVDVMLPRFEMKTPSLRLESELVAMGMPRPFDRATADFTAIANPSDPRERLHVSKVFHKAFVKVDEKGTEAAAATAIVMAKGGGAPPPATPFHADHPFLFAIVEKSSGLLLFMGRVVDPSAE